jgi:uncharacterized protein YggE
MADDLGVRQQDVHNFRQCGWRFRSTRGANNFSRSDTKCHGKPPTTPLAPRVRIDDMTDMTSLDKPPHTALNRRHIATAFMSMMLIVPATSRAQTKPGAASEATSLSLSVTGHATHVPNQTIATLIVQDESRSPSKAQAAVNQSMAKALTAAQAIHGLSATTGAYSVAQTDPKTRTWQASQTLTLTFDAAPNAIAAAPVRHLIGALQHRGLLLESIGAGLTPSALRQTRAEAITDAIGQMHGEAEAAATAMDLKIGRVRRMQINTETPIRPMMLAMRAQSPPPAIQAGPIEATINLSATIDLVDR